MNRRALVLAGLAWPLVGRAQSSCVTTPEDIEGPFYKAGAPARASLVDPASRAEKLVLSGVVRSTECQALAGVTLDFWHADAAGNYDTSGYRYRGVVTTDAEGRYRLETNLPPPYSGRPRHIHVKVRRLGGPVLTTQLYFSGESRGANPALVVRIQTLNSVKTAVFDFQI